MYRIAPSEKDITNDALEKPIWGAANRLRAKSGLKSSRYSHTVLGLILLRKECERFLISPERTAITARIDVEAEINRSFK